MKYCVLTVVDTETVSISNYVVTSILSITTQLLLPTALVLYSFQSRIMAKKRASVNCLLTDSSSVVLTQN